MRTTTRLAQPVARTGGAFLALLDFGIGLVRKTAGFVALLSLGWLYFRELALGQSLATIFAGAPDPDLRETLWVAFLLILAQGWDIPTDRLAADWERLSGQIPMPAIGGPGGLALPTVPLQHHVEALIVRLGRFMDLCVAIANKVGAFAVLVYVLVLVWQIVVLGTSVASMYPHAHDPWTSFLADLCVYAVVIGWWAMPFGQIVFFWHRLRGRDDATDGPVPACDDEAGPTFGR